MKRLIGAVILFVATGYARGASIDTKLCTINFSDAPLRMAASIYGEWSEKKVVVAEGANVSITVKSDEKISIRQGLGEIGLAITNAGIEIVELEQGTLTFRRGQNLKKIQQQAVIRPADIVTNYANSGCAERRRQRLAQMSGTNSDAASSTKLRAELQKHLQDYQMEIIRQGLPPTGVRLTPEQDAQLVREGVIPPPPNDSLTNRPPASK